MNGNQKLNNDLFDKYLSLLGIPKTSPNFDLLEQIVNAHLIKVPFENISKLIFKKEGFCDIPDLSTYLNGIEKYNFGGTCYSNNYYLYLLLEYLGFDIILCGADMNEKDVHIVSIVTINNKEYIVDVGYAAPFYKPMDRNLKHDQVIESGNEKYVLKSRDRNNYSKMKHYINGELKHGYIAKPFPRKINFFNSVIEDSYADYSTFMNAIRITKFTENGSLSLRNLNFSTTIGENISHMNISFDEIPDIVEKNFGMPAEKVAIALSMIKELKDIHD
ncbi:MAG: arylamine N-acetyltransferase [Ignavibacteria bacterium]